MKWSIFVLFVLGASAHAKDVKEFNKVLIETVNKDLKSDNVERLKVRRAPASVESVAPAGIPQEESKIDKNFRQIGPSKW